MYTAYVLEKHWNSHTPSHWKHAQQHNTSDPDSQKPCSKAFKIWTVEGHDVPDGKKLKFWCVFLWKIGQSWPKHSVTLATKSQIKKGWPQMVLMRRPPNSQRVDFSQQPMKRAGRPICWKTILSKWRLGSSPAMSWVALSSSQVVEKSRRRLIVDVLNHILFVVSNSGGPRAKQKQTFHLFFSNFACL